VKELRAYRPVMGSVVSTDIWKKPLTFTTLDNHRETLSMVMVNDIHGNNELQKKLLGIAPPQDFDMVLFCGDMCSHINRQSDIFTSFLNTSIELFAAQKPFVYARGNHETRGAYARNFSRYFAGSNGKFYYAFTYGPVRFIVLDCGEDKPDDHWVYYGLNDFTRLRNEQVDFLKKELASKEFKKAEKRILIHHIPLYGNDYKNLCEDLWKPLLKKAPFNVSLNAHTHEYAYHPKGKLDNNFPVIVGGGYDMDSATVMVIEKKKGELRIKVLNTKGEILLNITV